MGEVGLVAMIVAAVAGLAWVLSGLLESATRRFYHSSLERRQPTYPESLLGGSILCPYCKSGVLISDLIASCEKCATLHHFDCWNSAGGCSVFGCEGKSNAIV